MSKRTNAKSARLQPLSSDLESLKAGLQWRLARRSENVVVIENGVEYESHDGILWAKTK